MLMKGKKEDAENGIKKIFSSSKAKELKSSYIIEKKRPEFKKFFDFLYLKWMPYQYLELQIKDI